MGDALFTIGHSNHSIDRLRELLAEFAIEVVIDVRSSPNSRYSPQFNRDRLSQALVPDARYAWMGDSLGGRPSSREFYDEGGHVLYGPLSQTPEFQRGLEQLVRNAARYRIALLCAENQPAECHRHLLVARCLVRQGFDPGAIRHILGDGSEVAEASMVSQALLLEDAWRSPLSVLPEAALAPSSNG